MRKFDPSKPYVSIAQDGSICCPPESVMKILKRIETGVEAGCLTEDDRRSMDIIRATAMVSDPVTPSRCQVDQLLSLDRRTNPTEKFITPRGSLFEIFEWCFRRGYDVVTLESIADEGGAILARAARKARKSVWTILSKPLSVEQPRALNEANTN